MMRENRWAPRLRKAAVWTSYGRLSAIKHRDLVSAAVLVELEELGAAQHRMYAHLTSMRGVATGCKVALDAVM